MQEEQIEPSYPLGKRMPGRQLLDPGSWPGLIMGRPLLPAIVVLALLFVVLTALVLRADLQPTPWDRVLTHEMQELPSFPAGTILVAVSWIGFAPWNWLLGLAILLFMATRRWYAEALFTSIAAAGGLAAEIIKNLIDRPRPTPDLAQVTTILHSYSFPSGHVTSYATFFGFLFYLTFTSLPRRSPYRFLLLSLFGLLILLVGPSRVYMGQHWASDALAGYALGFAYLLGVVEAYRAWTKAHSGAPPTPPTQGQVQQITPEPETQVKQT
ncbi:MAG TPA: phosphatase PAP2 family protein [Chloroflexia bacterium]|nr:phosphatase PAP2 family protein [Chloroflexia bacterium]